MVAAIPIADATSLTTAAIFRGDAGRDLITFFFAFPRACGVQNADVDTISLAS